MWKMSVMMLTGANLAFACPDKEVAEKANEKPVVEKTAAQKADELSKRIDWETARLVKGSESKNGVGLYRVNVDGLTISYMILKHSEKAWALAIVNTPQVDVEQKDLEKTLQVKWNPSGTKVAIHNASAKHSFCQIYYLTEANKFERAKLPGGPRWMAARAGVKDKQKVVSSGREPIEWKRDDLLFIQFRFRTDDHKLYRRKFPLLIDDKGVYHVQ